MSLANRLPQNTVVTLPTVLHPSRPATRAEIIQISAHQKSLFERSDTAKKQAALNWETVVLAVDRIKGFRGSASEAVRLLLNRAADGDLDPHVANALSAVAVGKYKKLGRLPTRSTIFEKLKAYKDEGLDGLVKEHKGRIRQEGGWEGLALELYSQPSKPDISAVHMKLVNTYKQKCTVDQVRAYLRALPATLGQMSPARIGRDLYKQTQAKYIERCTANLLPGDIYMADGYRADVYLAHPLTGKIWRPEIMHIIDMRSRVLVGYQRECYAALAQHFHAKPAHQHENYWFTRHPHWLPIRDLVLQGKTYGEVAILLQRSRDCVRRAVKSMVKVGLINPAILAQVQKGIAKLHNLKRSQLWGQQLHLFG